jgi:hypothetical protein
LQFPSANSSSLSSPYQLGQRQVGIADHAGADAFQKSIVPEFPTCYGLIIRISRRFCDRSEQRFHKRINKCKQCLLPDSDPPDFAGKAIQTCRDSLLALQGAVVATSEFPFDRDSKERAGIGKPVCFHRVFNKLNESGGHERKTKSARPLSAKTVRHIAGVVHTALTTAIEWGLLKIQPMHHEESAEGEEARSPCS